MWEVWLSLRLAEQERQAHLKLSSYTPPTTPSPLSLWRDVSTGNNSVSSYGDSTQGGNSAANSGHNIGIAGVTGVSPAFSPKTGDVKALGSAVVADTVDVLSSVMSALSAQVNSSTTSSAITSATTSATTSVTTSANSSTNNSNSHNKPSGSTQASTTVPATAPTKTVEIDEFNLDEAEEWLNSNTTVAPSSGNNPLSNFSLAEDFDESEWESANTFLDKFSPTSAATKNAPAHSTNYNDSSDAAMNAVDEILAGKAVATPVGGTVAKSSSEVVSKVHGRSQILTPAMIQQIEQVGGFTMCYSSIMYSGPLLAKIVDDGYEYFSHRHCRLRINVTTGTLFIGKLFVFFLFTTSFVCYYLQLLLSLLCAGFQTTVPM